MAQSVIQNDDDDGLRKVLSEMGPIVDCAPVTVPKHSVAVPKQRSGRCGDKARMQGNAQVRATKYEAACKLGRFRLLYLGCAPMTEPRCEDYQWCFRCSRAVPYDEFSLKSRDKYRCRSCFAAARKTPAPIAASSARIGSLEHGEMQTRAALFEQAFREVNQELVRLGQTPVPEPAMSGLEWCGLCKEPLPGNRFSETSRNRHHCRSCDSSHKLLRKRRR
jgi:hypothetical protein